MRTPKPQRQTPLTDLLQASSRLERIADDEEWDRRPERAAAIRRVAASMRERAATTGRFEPPF